MSQVPLSARMLPHPTPIIADHVSGMRRELALIRYAITGAIDLQDHSKLSDHQVSESLLDGFAARFEALDDHLRALEAVAEEIALKGAASVAENLAAAHRDGVL